MLFRSGKYDFVQGDTIIFEDDFATETLGEFPSKWKLIYGAAENLKSGEYPCLGFMQVSSQVAPLMKAKDFLPKVFTVEFDIYFYLEGNEAYTLNFGPGLNLEIRSHRVSYGQFSGTPLAKASIGWHHIAIAVNDKKMKVYFDEERVLNIPEIPKSLVTVEFRALSHGAARGKPSIIKSVRIAKGGMDLYKRIITDGKYIARGILFDVNKATLKPQSMGQINEMVKMMKEHPELKFNIEGHTDSEGDDKSNHKLSEERAQVVKEQMISMGIEDSRLDAKGHGESQPTNDNSTPEGKANNRRVEFIKK